MPIEENPAVDLKVSPTFGAQQNVQLPAVAVAPPPVELQQVYTPNSANVINGNEAGFAAQNSNAVQTGTTGNIVSPPDATGTETIGGTNPLIWNSPPVFANGFNPDPNAPSKNPNQENAKQAAQQKSKPTKNVNETSNKNVGKTHTVTPQEIRDLEKQTNLTLYPYLFSGELARIKHQFSNMNQNKYYLLLNMLVYGFDNKILQSGMYGSEKCVIDKAFLNDFLKMAKTPQLQEIIKKTPAYQKGSFEDLGKLGVTQANANNMGTSPITGPKSEHPSLVTALMERIHPGAVAELEGFCNKVRTNAYLSLPKRAFASLQHLVAGINSVVSSFFKIITDIYNGIMYYIQQIFGLINGLIAKITQLITDFIESIIPADLLCILVAILGKMASDIPFFSSIMNMSFVTSGFQNSFQTYMSKATGGVSMASFASDPFRAVSKYMPPQVSQVVSLVGKLNNNPQAFLGSMLSNYGFGIAAQHTQSALLKEITFKMGANFASLHPFGSILGANSDLPKAPDAVGPTTFKDGKEDIHGHPTNSSEINSNSAGGANAVSSEAKNAINNVANPASMYTEPLKFTPTPPSGVSSPQVGPDYSASYGNIA
jgi:hypothetical protein